MSEEQVPDKLYAAREPVFPKRVKGTFRSLKWWLMGLMLGAYYLLPCSGAHGHQKAQGV